MKISDLSFYDNLKAIALYRQGYPKHRHLGQHKGFEEFCIQRLIQLREQIRSLRCTSSSLVLSLLRSLLVLSQPVLVLVLPHLFLLLLLLVFSFQMVFPLLFLLAYRSPVRTYSLDVLSSITRFQPNSRLVGIGLAQEELALLGFQHIPAVSQCNNQWLPEYLRFRDG